MGGKIKRKAGVRQLLSSSSKRVTSQRTLLLELLRHSGGHVDADGLYRRARKKNPRISLSTVYRNLLLFKKLELVDERHFDEEHHHYEVKSGEEHQHLLCIRCGKVIEFDYTASRKFKKDVGQRYGFHITGVEIHMTGLCSGCRKKESKTMSNRS